MPDPVTRAGLDVALAKALARRPPAVLECACPAHPYDGCVVRPVASHVVAVRCWTCDVTITHIAVGIPLGVNTGVGCPVGHHAGYLVFYVGQGMVDLRCFTCHTSVAHLAMAH